MNIVGVAGLPRSGKDTVAELFMDHGWFGVSLGDIVREESRKRHAGDENPISVKNMTETSNYLRTAYGPDFAMRHALERFKKVQEGYKGLVVYSVRAPSEVDFILSHEGQLVWVESSDEVRLQRAQNSRRDGEPLYTLEEMKAHEALQQQPQPGVPREVQMDISYVKKHATKVITNNGNHVETFKRQVEKILELN